jgi:hypothetical protein
MDGSASTVLLQVPTVDIQFVPSSLKVIVNARAGDGAKVNPTARAAMAAEAASEIGSERTDVALINSTERLVTEMSIFIVILH